MITSIEWCRSRLPDGTYFPGYSFNPWWGCAKVKGSPACDHCYAESGSRMRGFTGDHDAVKPALWGKQARRRFFGEHHWNEPLRWERNAIALGARLKVFCASYADVFELLPSGHPDRERMEVERQRLWRLIDATPHLDWLLLTKRPSNIQIMVPPLWAEHGCPDNVWLGASTENQRWLDARANALNRVAAKVHFISVEPQSDYVDPTPYFASGPPDNIRNSINWVIAGGESGHAAKPSHPDWFLKLKQSCRMASVPFFFKQWGEWKPENEAPVGGPRGAKRITIDDGRWPASKEQMVRVGKGNAGAKLYGAEYRDEPNTYFGWTS